MRRAARFPGRTSGAAPGVLMRRVLLLTIVSCVGTVLAGEPPSRYGVDAPELAHLGEQAVGVRTLHLVDRGQIDVLAFDAAKGSAPVADRALSVDLWYPAHPRPGAPRAVYAAKLPSKPPAAPAGYSVPSIAVTAETPSGTGLPLCSFKLGCS